MTGTGAWDSARPVSASWTDDPDHPVRIVETAASIEQRVLR